MSTASPGVVSVRMTSASPPELPVVAKSVVGSCGHLWCHGTRYTVDTAQPRLARVRCTYSGQEAGTRIGPVRTVPRPRDVHCTCQHRRALQLRGEEGRERGEVVPAPRGRAVLQDVPRVVRGEARRAVL